MHQQIPSERTDVQEAVQVFARWRHSKPTRRARIPEDLWELACRMAKVHGVARISRELKLDYYRLKRQLSSQSKSGQDELRRSCQRQTSSAAFVEFPPLSIGGTTEGGLDLDPSPAAHCRLFASAY